MTAAVVIDGQIDDGRAFRENLASGKAADSRAQQMIEGTALIGPFLRRKAGASAKISRAWRAVTPCSAAWETALRSSALSWEILTGAA